MLTPVNAARREPARPKHKAPSMRTWRHLRHTAAICAAIFSTWILAGIWLFVAPAGDTPERTDVLFVLGPPDERIDYAEQLMQQGGAVTLAVSSPVDQSGQFVAPICRETRAYRIVCFHPEPFTTQGEARALQAMSQEHGWQSANVLTAQHHVTRAKVLIERCYKGDFRMVQFDAKLVVTSWPFLYVYHTAAFVKVALNPSC